MKWKIHHKSETVSTNIDARAGRPGDVFTADFQSAGRGRLDHKWLSAPGENLMMSAVLDVADLPPELVATLPLVVGLAVLRALLAMLPHPGFALKWPNDVLVEGRKIAGILCERHQDAVIAGLGVNVRQRLFAPELADRATSLALLGSAADEPSVTSVRDAVLRELDTLVAAWRQKGFASLLPQLARHDFLKGRTIGVKQTDDDAAPILGLCDGISEDGSLLVAGTRIYAGEAHVMLERQFE